MSWLAVFLAVLIILTILRRGPRIYRRHRPAPAIVHTILDKRTVPPPPGSDRGVGDTAPRYQLLLEDEDGRQVWTWCDEPAYEVARSGDSYSRGQVGPPVS